MPRWWHTQLLCLQVKWLFNANLVNSVEKKGWKWFFLLNKNKERIMDRIEPTQTLTCSVIQRWVNKGESCYIATSRSRHQLEVIDRNWFLWLVFYWILFKKRWIDTWQKLGVLWSTGDGWQIQPQFQTLLETGKLETDTEKIPGKLNR